MPPLIVRPLDGDENDNVADAASGLVRNWARAAVTVHDDKPRTRSKSLPCRTIVSGAVVAVAVTAAPPLLSRLATMEYVADFESAAVIVTRQRAGRTSDTATFVTGDTGIHLQHGRPSASERGTGQDRVPGVGYRVVALNRRNDRRASRDSGRRQDDVRPTMPLPTTAEEETVAVRAVDSRTV